VDYVTRIAELIRAELRPEALPEEPVGELLRIYAVLTLALGEEVSPADVHDAWVAWMAARDGTHTALLPFEELDKATANEDLPFVTAIRSVARTHNIGRRGPRGEAL